jgi:hypothetical protein
MSALNEQQQQQDDIARASSAMNEMEARASPLTVLFKTNLSYEEKDETAEGGEGAETSVCFTCGASELAGFSSSSASETNDDDDDDNDESKKKSTKKKALLVCSQCRIICYCSAECQKKDWKSKTSTNIGSHKSLCAAYKDLYSPPSAPPPPGIDFSTNAAVADIQQKYIENILRKIRFYLCPYFVHNCAEQGKGFIFIQSNNTLFELSLPIPKNRHGKAVNNGASRSVTMHFLTMGEFDQEVVREDFEMGACRNELRVGTESCDPDKELIVMLRFRCGELRVVRMDLVPPVGVCRALTKEYVEWINKPMMQFNVDDI